MRLKSLDRRIKYRITRSKENVFVLKDFSDLSDKDQVGRALRKLIEEGKLVKIGYGLYAKGAFNKFAGRVMPAQPLPWLAKEALGKLRVRTAPGSFERLYNEGKSTQVPTGRVIGVRDRISRKIGFDTVEIFYERVPG